MYLYFKEQNYAHDPKKHGPSEGRDSEHEPCGQSEQAPTSTAIRMDGALMDFTFSSPR